MQYPNTASSMQAAMPRLLLALSDRHLLAGVDRWLPGSARVQQCLHRLFAALAWLWWTALAVPAFAASVVTGSTYINAPVVWNDTVSVACPTGTALGGCVQVAASGQLVVTGALNFQAAKDGRVQVLGGVLALNTGTTTTGADDDSHVVGWLTKVGNNAFVFPVGDGVRLGQMGMGAPAATSDSVRARFIYADPTAAFGSSKQATLTAISTNQYWQLAGVTNPVTGTTGSNPSVVPTLYWSATNVLPATLSPTNLVVAGWDGTQWVNLGQGAVTGNATAGSVSAATAVTVNTYSAYTLATQTSAVSLTNSTLSCAPATPQVTGSVFTCTATARDATNAIISGVPLTLAAASGSTPSATGCTTNASGQCTFTVTSVLAGGYAVTAQSGGSHISGSPVTVTFTAPVMPACTATPSPAAGSTLVTVSCTGGTPGDTPSLSGAVCTPAPIPASGAFSCQGTGNALGNNPSLTITSPTGTSNSGAVPLAVDNTPPAAPSCIASPNPSNQTGPTSITCSNIAVGDKLSIPGTNCTPTTNPGPGTSVTCTSTSNTSVAANPTATVTDPAGNVSTKTVPYLIDTGAPVVSVTSAPGINTGNQASYTFGGTCSENGNPVTVSIGSITVTAACNATAWTVSSLDVSSLPQGTVLITLTQEDSAHNVGSNSSTTLKDLSGPALAFTSTPVITLANYTAYTVAGTCTSAAGQVKFTMAGATPSPQNVNCTGGVFSATVDTTGIADGSVVPFNAAQTDPVTLNTTTTNGSVSKDTTKPNVQVTTASTINSANQASYGASGTCSESGLPVTVAVGGVSAPSPTCSAAGTWSVANVDVSTLADGAVTISAKQTRALSGNSAIGTLDVQKDVTSPSAPLCTASPNPSNQTAASTVITCTNIASGDRLSIPGTVCSPAVSTGANVVCTSTSPTSVLANPTATVTDPFNNQATATVGYVIDTTPPNLPANSCTATPSSAGGTTPVSIVCVVDPATVNTIPGTTCGTPVTAGASTTVTCTGTGASIATSPTLTSTDAAGNTNTQSVAFTQIGAPPPPACTASPNPSNQTVNVVFTCTNIASGDSVTIPGTTCSPLVSTGGNVSCTSNSLTAVFAGPTATVSRPGGLTNANAIAYVIDTDKPVAPSCTANPVSAVAGATVQITCNNVEIGSTTVIAGATCVPTPATSASVVCTGLANALGSNPTVTTTDTAGNSNSAQVAFTAIGGASASTSSLSCSPLSVPAASASTCTATARDASNNLVPGTSVAFTSAAGSTLSAAACTTNASGVCSVTLTSNTAAAYPVTAKVGGTDIGNSPVNVTFTALAALAANSALSCSPATAKAGTNINCVVTARDAHNNLASGGSFTLSVSSGASLSASSCTTDTVGQCGFTVTSSTSGTYAVNALFGGATAITGSPANLSFTVPFITVSTPALISSGNQGAYSVSGTCSEEGVAVTLAVGSVVVTPKPVCTAGAWTAAAVNVTSLAQGAVLITASQIDSANNVASVSAGTTKNLTGPVVAFTSTPIISNGNKASYPISGTCSTTGSLVTVAVAGATPPTQDVSCTAAGTFVATFDVTALTDGTVAFSAAQTDPVTLNTTTTNGGTTKDTVNPSVVVSTAPAISAANQASYAVSGTCSENGLPVVVTIGTITVSPDASCSATGTWAVSGVNASSLSDGTVAITATQTRLSGNAATGNRSVMKDTASAAAPSCTATPNPASASQTVSITCTGVESGATVNIPGATCTASGTTVSCTGSGANLGNNPPVRTVDAAGNVTTSVLPLVFAPTAGVTPPALPSCTASPNPASGSTAVTLTCTGVSSGNTVSVPGASCTTSGTTVTCTATAASLGSNPTITVTDGTTGLSSSGTIPLATSSISTPLPSCTASPNPAGAGTAVTINCTGVSSGSTVSIPGMTCTASGTTVSCTGGTGASLGTNPVITVSNPTTGTTRGTVPLVSSPAVKTFSGNVATGQGLATATLSGGGANCGFDTAQTSFTTPPGSPPANLQFPYGVFAFKAVGCGIGSTVTVTVTWPGNVSGKAIWKYGPATAGAAVSTWFNTGVTASGTTTVYSVTDGGVGEGNLLVDGVLIDPFGPVDVGDPAANMAAIPAMDDWALCLLALALFAVSGMALRQRRTLL